MDRPFSERVAGEDWRSEVEAWAVAELARTGREVTGPTEQLRIRPWSTQLTIPTQHGTVWFKANCATLAFEPRLQALLAELLPHAVDAPLAVEPDRGWMLTVDRGETLGDHREPTLDDWQRVVTAAAQMQQVLAGHRDELLKAGVPDCSPATVVDRFDRLVDTLAGLPGEHPSHVSPELEARLRATRPAIVDAARQLDESALPTTWQHGDLHPRNVFAVGGGELHLFDFGDAQWSHAVEVLSVPYGWVTTYTDLAWRDVLEPYCAVWGTTPEAVEADWRATALSQPVNRTLLWWVALEQATAAEWAEWGEGPIHHLTRVLDA
ncbi:MAG: aminoglycoside phosphotransferase family protein [Aeromicrobium sp.]